MPDEVTQNSKKQIPLEPLGEASEVVDAALLLASPRLERVMHFCAFWQPRARVGTPRCGDRCAWPQGGTYAHHRPVMPPGQRSALSLPRAREKTRSAFASLGALDALGEASPALVI